MFFDLQVFIHKYNPDMHEENVITLIPNYMLRYNTNRVENRNSRRVNEYNF